MSTERKNYCALPFFHTAIEANGEVMACCLTPAFRTETGEPFNLNFHTLEQVYASSDFQAFTQSFRDDQRHPYCKQCWFDDDSGTISNRVKFTKWLETRLNVEKFSLERDLKFLEVKVGNACNLMCRICGPHNSSKAALEDFTMTGRDDGPKINRLSRWIAVDHIWESLSRLDLKAIHIMGGEPFIDNSHLKLLRRLIELNKSADIALWYNTNGTTYPDQFLDLWAHFKSVQISVSIDDFGRRFEYQRYPGRWEAVKKNLLSLYELGQRPKITTGMDICWSLFNIYYAEEIITYFENFFAENKISLGNEIADTFHFYTGGHFCPRTLRPQERSFIKDRLSSSIYYDHAKYGGLVKKLIDHIEYDDYKTATELERVKKLQVQDRFRKQNFVETFPEISFIFKADLLPAPEPPRVHS